MKIAGYAIIGLGLTVNACATTDTNDFYAAQLESPYQNQSQIKAILPEDIAPSELEYTCDDETSLRVRYYGEVVASAILPQISDTRAYLEGKKSGDGVSYTAGPLEIYRDDDGILLSDGDNLDLACQLAL